MLKSMMPALQFLSPATIVASVDEALHSRRSTTIMLALSRPLLIFYAA